METLIMNAELPEAMERAARLFSSGELVAFPTETVYGLGDNALESEPDDGSV